MLQPVSRCRDIGQHSSNTISSVLFCLVFDLHQQLANSNSALRIADTQEAALLQWWARAMQCKQNASAHGCMHMLVPTVVHWSPELNVTY